MDGEIDVEVKLKINEVGKVWGGMKRMLKCISLGMNARRRLYEGVLIPTTVYGIEI